MINLWMDCFAGITAGRVGDRRDIFPRQPCKIMIDLVNDRLTTDRPLTFGPIESHIDSARVEFFENAEGGPPLGGMEVSDSFYVFAPAALANRGSSASA